MKRKHFVLYIGWFNGNASRMNPHECQNEDKESSKNTQNSILNELIRLHNINTRRVSTDLHVIVFILYLKVLFIFISKPRGYTYLSSFFLFNIVDSPHSYFELNNKFILFFQLQYFMGSTPTMLNGDFLAFERNRNCSIIISMV